MAARGLEGRLTSRLAPVFAVSLAVVAGVAIVTTSRALAAAEEARARALATTALRSFVEELGEQEAPAGSIAAAAREVDDEVDGQDVHVEVTPSASDVARLGAYVTPGPGFLDVRADADVAAGACALVDRDGSRWRACAAGEDGRRATVAVRTDGDRLVVRRLAGGMLVTFFLAVLAALSAARRALHEPLDDVRCLAEWSEELAGKTAQREVPPLSLPAPPTPRARTRELAQLTSSIGALVGALVETLDRERASSAHIAHEMRTPLTALRADLDALGPEADPVAERLRADVDRLAQVIDAVSILSSPRRQRGQRRETVNVADVARSLVPAGATVEAPEEALVDADGALIRLALVNLVDNARRHAAPGARVVRVRRDGDAVRLSVLDAGPGLDPDMRARVFDRYWRGADEIAGRGLGLALVRAVAEQHDGAADIRSLPGGPGLDIGFTLRPLLAWHEGEPTPGT